MTDALPDYKAMGPGAFLQAVGMDAQKWTDAYYQTWPDGLIDESIMLGWFANAIMAGYDSAPKPTAPTLQALPEGFVLVPIEPTEAMIKAYCETCERFGFHAWVNASTVWPAMLTAAPLPPIERAGIAGFEGSPGTGPASVDDVAWLIEEVWIGPTVGGHYVHEDFDIDVWRAALRNSRDSFTAAFITKDPNKAMRFKTQAAASKWMKAQRIFFGGQYEVREHMWPAVPGPVEPSAPDSLRTLANAFRAKQEEAEEHGKTLVQGSPARNFTLGKSNAYRDAEHMAYAALALPPPDQQPQSGWQDIASAPKDGTIIECWSPREEVADDRLFLGNFEPDDGNGHPYWRNRYGSMMEDPICWRPHNVPLQPPKAADQSSRADHKAAPPSPPQPEGKGT